MRTIIKVKNDLVRMNYDIELLDLRELQELASLPASSYERKLAEMDLVRTKNFLQILGNIELA